MRRSAKSRRRPHDMRHEQTWNERKPEKTGAPFRYLPTCCARVRSRDRGSSTEPRAAAATRSRDNKEEQKENKQQGATGESMRTRWETKMARRSMATEEQDGADQEEEEEQQ